MQPTQSESQPTTKQSSTLRHVIWRGISIIAPPLVTLLLLIWLLSTIEQYVLLPLESGIRQVMVYMTADILREAPPGSKLIDPANPEAGFIYEGLTYVQPPLGRDYLSNHIVKNVNASLHRLPRDMQRPMSANDYCAAYIKLNFMPRSFTIPLLLLALLSGLFFIGRFFAAGIGRFVFNLFESMITQVPFISNIYSSVKQVTDFVFSDRDIEFTRVVAVEYPKAEVWSIGFVTSEGIPQLKKNLDREMVAIFIPTSPMPMTGFTINVPKSAVIDLDMTIDQAIQFMVSCGVVCPVPGARTLVAQQRKLPDKT